jgi:hypothetical protein
MGSTMRLVAAARRVFPPEVAMHLFAAFDTRTGEVMGILRRRKRQVEFIE